MIFDDIGIAPRGVDLFARDGTCRKYTINVPAHGKSSGPKKSHRRDIMVRDLSYTEDVHPWLQALSHLGRN